MLFPFQKQGMFKKKKKILGEMLLGSSLKIACRAEYQRSNCPQPHRLCSNNSAVAKLFVASSTDSVIFDQKMLF